MMRFKTSSGCKVLQWGRGPSFFLEKNAAFIVTVPIPGKLVLPIIQFLADNIIPV